jgi:hypothetical protein
MTHPFLPAPRRKFEIAGWFGVAALAAYFLAVSWRKWPDPLVDFGRELYIPWRVAHGAVLFRDVDDFYGPLSQYFNAALFAVFGPGLMVLVAANLAVYAAILSVLSVLFRRAWGPAAALVAVAVFIAVFSFSQLTTTSNYNYATPYAHETTHGLLVCLLLLAVLGGWIERATVVRSFFAGGLLGLAAVLKPEFLLAGSLAIAAAAALRWRLAGRRGWRPLVAGIAGAALPTVFFTGYFAFYFPPGAALRRASRGWLNAVGSTNFFRDPAEQGFLGFDRPLLHLEAQAKSTLAALGMLTLLAGAAWAVERIRDGRVRASLAAVLPAALGFAAWLWIPWVEIGRCLLGLAALYGVFKLAAFFRAEIPAREFRMQSARLLLAVLGAALMARMVLNGRVYQYGYYQAAIAGMLVPAVLLGEAPAWLRLGRIGRAVFVAGTLLLIGSGTVRIAVLSRQMLRNKTLAIGEGRDLFYAFPPRLYPYSDVVRVLSGYFREQPGDKTLVVLPEGQMINYLARKRSPVAPYAFFAAATADGREAGIVEQLDRHPPDYVAFIKEDLEEYGIRTYGDDSGKLIVGWLAEHYTVAAGIPTDPLNTPDPRNPDNIGALIFRHNGVPPAGL